MANIVDRRLVPSFSPKYDWFRSNTNKTYITSRITNLLWSLEAGREEVDRILGILVRRRVMLSIPKLPHFSENVLEEKLKCSHTWEKKRVVIGFLLTFLLLCWPWIRRDLRKSLRGHDWVLKRTTTFTFPRFPFP